MDTPLVKGPGEEGEVGEANPPEPEAQPKAEQIGEEPNALAYPPSGVGEEPGSSGWGAAPESTLPMWVSESFDPLGGGFGEEWFHEPIPPSMAVAIPLAEEQWVDALRQMILSGPDGKI